MELQGVMVIGEQPYLEHLVCGKVEKQASYRWKDFIVNWGGISHDFNNSVGCQKNWNLEMQK